MAEIHGIEKIKEQNPQSLIFTLKIVVSLENGIV